MDSMCTDIVCAGCKYFIPFGQINARPLGPMCDACKIRDENGWTMREGTVASCLPGTYQDELPLPASVPQTPSIEHDLFRTQQREDRDDPPFDPELQRILDAASDDEDEELVHLSEAPHSVPPLPPRSDTDSQQPVQSAAPGLSMDAIRAGLGLTEEDDAMVGDAPEDMAAGMQVNSRRSEEGIYPEELDDFDEEQPKKKSKFSRDYHVYVYKTAEYSRNGRPVLDEFGSAKRKTSLFGGSEARYNPNAASLQLISVGESPEEVEQEYKLRLHARGDSNGGRSGSLTKYPRFLGQLFEDNTFFKTRTDLFKEGAKEEAKKVFDAICWANRDSNKKKWTTRSGYMMKAFTDFHELVASQSVSTA